MSEEIFGEEDKRLMTESGKMEDNMNELEEIGADTNYSSKKIIAIQIKICQKRIKLTYKSKLLKAKK